MECEVEEVVVANSSVELSKSKVVSLWFACLFMLMYGFASIYETLKYIGGLESTSKYVYLVSASVIVFSAVSLIAVVCIYFVFIYENKIVGWYLMVASLLLKVSMLIIFNGVFYILYKYSGVKGYDVILSRASGGFIVLDTLLLHYFMNWKVLRYFEVKFVNHLLVRNLLMIACFGMGVLLFRV
jgi:hypothetical protein